MKVLKILSLIGPMVFLSMAVAAQEKLSIDSCQVMAERNYPLIKQYELIEQSKEFNLSNAGKAYLPQLSVTGIGAYIFSGLPSISLPGLPEQEENKANLIGIGQLNQTLWDGGATRTQKQIIEAQSEIEKSNIAVALHGVKGRVNQLFFGVLLIDEQLSQLQIHKDLLTKNLNRVSLSKENGLAYQSDVDELKAEVLLVDQRKTEFLYTRKAYVRMLSLLVGKELNDNIQLEIPVGLSSSNYSIIRPELQLYANQRLLTSAQSSISRVNTMPKVGLLGAGILAAPGIVFGTSEVSSLALGGLSVSWNIGGLYKTSNNKQLDQLSLSRIANQEEVFLFNTNQQLTQISAETEKFSAIIESDQQILDLRSGIREAFQMKYDNGLCSLYDLLNATDREQEARANKALHHIQWLMSIYQFKATSGN